MITPDLGQRLTVGLAVSVPRTAALRLCPDGAGGSNVVAHMSRLTNCARSVDA